MAVTSPRKALVIGSEGNIGAPLVAYLRSLGNEVLAMKLLLENVRKLMRSLGDPHTNYLKVQVPGTNVNGSVCEYLN